MYYILVLQLFHYSNSPYHSMDSSHHHPHSTPKLLVFFKACKSPGSCDVLGCKEIARTVAVWLLCLCKTPSLSTSSKWKILYLSSTGFDWILTLSLETVFTKSTNNQSLKMTALAPWKPLLCVELEYILAPLLILFTGNSSTSSIDVIPVPIAPILLELRFANWGFRRIFPLNTK